MNIRRPNVEVKLTNFINNNVNAPLKLKKSVMESCFYSSILYNCETWGCLADKKVIALYNYAAKCVLSVRMSTPNILVYKELQPKSINAIIAKQQLQFWIKTKQMPIIEDLIVKARNNGSKYIKYYDKLEERFTTPDEAFQQLNNAFRNDTYNSIIKADNSKRKIKQYFDIFDNFTKDVSISNTYDDNEQTRILLTKYALGSHVLEEEVGRWRRVPRDERLCKLCKRDIETLKHFLIDCPKLHEVRNKYSNYPSSVKQFFKWEICTIAIRTLHRTRMKYGR